MRLGRRGKSFGSLLFDAEVVLCIVGGVVVGVVLGTGGNRGVVSGSSSSAWTWESVGEQWR